MSQHSPGPWNVEPVTNGAGFRFINISDADGKRVFFVSATEYVGKETKDGWTRNRYDEVQNAQANANLAAAAAEMLAALESAPLPSTMGTAAEHYERFYDWWNTAAKTVIEKARGRVEAAPEAKVAAE